MALVRLDLVPPPAVLWHIGGWAHDVIVHAKQVWQVLGKAVLPR